MSIFDRRGASESEKDRKEVRQALPANAPRPITASAVRINLKDKKEIEAVSKRRQTDGWQDEAWEYYDYIPEVAFSANLVANILSRINLYAGYVNKSSLTPSEITQVEELDQDFKDTTEDILYLLETAKGGTSGILRDAALNFFIAGECYLVREPARFSNGMQEKYQIRSVNEIVTAAAATSSKKAKLAIKPRRDSVPADYITIPEDGYCARLWKSHPRYGDEADSSMRSLLELCDSLLLLERTINNESKSRLPAGILFIPDGLSNGFQSDGDMAPEDAEDSDLSDDESQAFEEELQDALMTPISDDSNAGSVVPLILRGSAELGEKIKHIPLGRAFDPNHASLASAKLDRILAGLDIPKDVAAGLSGVKYSNAILIEEQLYKAHIEPLILMIVDCLTTTFLRPALLAQGFDPKLVSRAVVWYDPSAIAAKPSKAESSTTGYQIGALSHEAWRRYNGFSDTDKPTDLERAQRFAMEKGLPSEAFNEKMINKLLPEEDAEAITQEALAQSDPEAVDALQDALGGTDFEPVATPDTITSDENTQPPTLLEP